MPNSNSTLIYLDTNVYSRPFDDQTQPDIQEEANAFLEVVREIEAERYTLLCSDILGFEGERGKGDSVKEIAEYWGDAGIEEIHIRVMEWKANVR